MRSTRNQPFCWQEKKILPIEWISKGMEIFKALKIIGCVA
jgi:hypothetical protein